MSLFTDWNDLLLSEYFSPGASGEEVWVQASRQELDSVGLHLGGADGLSKAVQLGAPWLRATQANCAEAALRLARQRRAGFRATGYIDPGEVTATYVGASAPTYLPILALWVLASSEEEEGFYAKVSSLLGQPFPNTPHLTSAMSEVWEDLEHWSAIECGGRFGEFRQRVLGGHRFVGIPRSQCLISRKDARGIRQLFVTCGLRPGQELTPALLARLADLGRDAHYLSSGLKSAFGRAIYREPLKHILGKVLQSWDGRRPDSPHVHQASHNGYLIQPEEFDDTTLALAPSADDEEGWDIRWRFTSSGQSNACLLVTDDIRIPARREPWGDCFTTQVRGLEQDTCQSMLAKSGTSDVEHGIEHRDEEAPEFGSGIRAGRIKRSPLRILAWDSPDPRFGEELVERGLPIAGPLYLVCSSNNRANLGRYLGNEGIECTSMLPKGLPNGWTLTCIPRAERLTEAQRHWLSEEDETKMEMARLRFVGGRPILRGGSRLYASYDLPIVEVEARASAILDAPGMQLEELRLQVTKQASPIRRFRIDSMDHDRLAFEIKVIDRAQLLASARLRISAPEGTGTGQARNFSMDSLGRFRNDDLGLRGTRIGDGVPHGGLGLASGRTQLDPVRQRDGTTILPQETICGKFLDSLAQLGSIGYGDARDQLVRLAESTGASIEPALLLMDLRSRAHLEIQTDSKGHLVRIHSVPPTLYSLPAAYDGLPLVGVCGTLRMQHWVDLLEHEACIALFEARMDERLPALRLATLGEEEVREVGQACGFRVDALPCDALSKWASSIEQAKGELSSWGWSSFSADLRQLQRLQPNAALFRAVPSRRMVVDNTIRSQLFRFDDPSVPGLQVYVLGTIEANGSTSYSFIHESRWGVWISETAFAQMLREQLAREDVYPWPIHYDLDRREFWLPARIRPPVVIERVLTLCSGAGPREVHVRGSLVADHIRLIEVDSGAMVGEVSKVYEAFTPGIWLCYKWVPEEVAIRVASLLGGEIKPLAEVRDCQAS